MDTSQSPGVDERSATPTQNGEPVSTPISSGPEADAGSTARPRPITISRVLFLIALGTAIAAYLIFPKNSPVAARGAITNIDVDANYVSSGIVVTISPDKTIHGEVISIKVNTFVTEPLKPTMHLYVPLQTFGGPTKCSQYVSCVTSGTVKELSFNPLKQSTGTIPPDYRYYYYQATVPIADITYNVTANKEYAAANIPNVTFYQTSGRSSPTPVEVPTQIHLTVRDASRYSWNSGVIPAVAGNTAVWNQVTTNSFGATGASGVALSIQDKDGKAVFIAGALLGIGGGALVGSIQEYRKRKEAVVDGS